MKFRHVLFLVACLAVAGLASSLFGESPVPRSPKQVYPVHTQSSKTPGSGHAFGYDIVYTIASHTTHKGQEHVVVRSVERGVEIWSPIPSLVAMADGSSFILNDNGSSYIDGALERIR